MIINKHLIAITVGHDELKLIADALLDWPGDFAGTPNCHLSDGDILYKNMRIERARQMGAELKPSSIGHEFQVD